ncbi:hypothetical protein [Saccharolobus islandicus]|uniref:Uncharacterized protein n=1 Tax=Saccharolobus islandicus (strain M.16.4 / Kamchatka \|nr:hypothetical protein [Sulfolobus islandicus]ACR41372.1 hypothetical protein M164_0754 [Sulfolobus islandicus M.16.4]
MLVKGPIMRKEEKEKENILKINWDKLEEMIEDKIKERIRYFEFFEYAIIDNQTLLIKIYDKDESNVFHVFTIKMRIKNDDLEIIEIY